MHERGARHLIDPSKLLASAQRLYGDDMERLWGEVVPGPGGDLRILAGGETVDGFRVAYTPGHASHHVSYLHEDSGTRLRRATSAGVRIGGSAGRSRRRRRRTSTSRRGTRSIDAGRGVEARAARA